MTNKLLLLLAGILTGICLTGISLAIEDPIGDFSFPDITNMNSEINNGYLEITITCEDAVTGEGSGTLSGTIFMDTDQNYLTGDNVFVYDGFDYVYNFNIINIIYAEPVITASLNNEQIYNSISLNKNNIFIKIPLSKLGNSVNMNIVAGVHGQMMESPDFDRVPDYGMLSIENGIESEVKIPFSGIKSALGNIKDIPEKTSLPVDITGLATGINNGNLYILINYDKVVEPGKVAYGDDILGKIYIDADQKLATGFKNVGEIPPTFGIDYIIDYTIGTLSGTSANIQKEDKGEFQTKGVPIGLPYNDASFKIKENQVLFTIPLGLLEVDHDDMDVVVESSTLQGLQNAQYDIVPENGAINIKYGAIKSVFSCTEPKMRIEDVAGDSFGKNYDGDDFSGIDACYSNNTLLLTMSYSSYGSDDASITTVYFDTNKDKDIIPDYIFMYQIYNGILKGFFSSKQNVVPIENTQLISMRPNKMYISIPLELLGNDDGNMNIYAETALIVYSANIPITDYGRKWLAGVGLDDIKTGVGEVHISPDKSSRTVYDKVPDTGYMEIKKGKNTENLKGDLNGNGQSADAGDLVMMKRASIGEIIADSRYDLNNNGQFADAGDLVLMKRASIGEINL